MKKFRHFTIQEHSGDCNIAVILIEGSENQKNCEINNWEIEGCLQKEYDNSTFLGLNKSLD